MYTSQGFREWEIGDIDLIRRGHFYHLFHLVLPNHDYIAHAISEDGMNWKRTRNAIFTGEPGAWDDDMLWTMHVSRNPKSKLYEMFYTGLERAERGHMQRIGRAVSRDLIRWRKDNELNLPLTPKGLHYEVAGESERGWISFRDPFLFRHEGEDWLLACARAPKGLVSKRGCVGVARRTEEAYELEEPLFYPRMYDDIECPCLVAMDGWFYLVGSIREDVEVHSWWSDTFRGEYRSYRNNVLLPRGNYAARTMQDGARTLIFSVFIDGLNVETGLRSLPPPKELQRSSDGGLELVSFYRWKDKVLGRRGLQDEPFRPHLDNPSAALVRQDGKLNFSSRSGYELYTVPVEEGAWIWEGSFQAMPQGRCGLVFGMDEQLNGYFVSLDTFRNVALVRAWGSMPERVFRNYIYEDLQSSSFTPNPQGRHRFSLIRWGSYIELSIDGIVRLTLVDSRFKGHSLGVFVESAEFILAESALLALEVARYDP